MRKIHRNGIFNFEQVSGLQNPGTTKMFWREPRIDFGEKQIALTGFTLKCVVEKLSWVSKPTFWCKMLLCEQKWHGTILTLV